MKKEVYKISGMSCAACSSAVERVTRKLDGVVESSVNLTTENLTIEYDEEKVNPELIMAKVVKAGFGIEPFVEKAKKDKLLAQNENNSEQALTEEQADISFSGIAIAGILTAILLYISMGQMIFENLPIPDLFNMNINPMGFALSQLIITSIVFVIGRKFFVKGIKGFVHFAPNMDSLVSIGCGCSYIYSLVMTFGIPENTHNVHQLYYESAAVVLTLIMLGKYLEGRSKKKTKEAITKLMELLPEKALVVRDGKTFEIPADEISVDDIVIVKAGDKLPADGIVIQGESTIDESMLTGESLPVSKTVGDKVTGGSINYNGVLYIKITEVGEDTTLSAIIRFVEEAQGKKAPISRLADKVAGIFVPTVMAIALVTGIIWLLVGKDFAFALQVFTAVLVIACPCSLGLATPTAIMVATGLGASNGILVRSGEVLEFTQNVDTVVLDKTGTITKGNLKVTDVAVRRLGNNAINDTNQEGIALAVLSLASTVESLSDHPLAKAVVSYFDAAKENVIAKGQSANSFIHSEENNDMQSVKVLEFEEVSGKGTKAKIIIQDKKFEDFLNTNFSIEKAVNGQQDFFSSEVEIKVGNEKWMKECGITLGELKNQAKTFANKGAALCFVAAGEEAIGLIALGDEIKESSIEAINLFKERGIQVIMVTGDNTLAAETIGKEAGVHRVMAEVLPWEKALKVEELQQQGAKVMMIGDGINDAPALTQADIGVAIGNGSDIALESSDIVLMKSNLVDAYKAISLSKITVRNIKQNLFWAFIYNIIGIPLAAGVLYPSFGILLSPMVAGFAMSMSSLCVVTNALRLKGKKLV